MTTATQTFEKKFLYHGELVRVTNPAGLSVVLKGKPKDGKFQPVIYFTVQGDDQEYGLNIENDEIRAYFDACPMGVPVTLRAFGTREGATVVVENGDGPLVVGGQPAQNVADGPPPTQWKDDEVETAPPAQTNGLEDVYLRCLLTAHAAQRRFMKETGHPVTDEDIRIATTLLIQTNGR